MACLEVLRRARPLLAEPALRDQAGDSESFRTGRRSTMMILKRLVCSAGPLLTLGLVFATPLLAQEQAAFGWHGLLRDSAGAPIADAKVKLMGTATAEANTGADGSFTLSVLRGGQYRLAIIAEGKTAAYAQAITLAPDAPPVVITDR